MITVNAKGNQIDAIAADVVSGEPQFEKYITDDVSREKLTMLVAAVIGRAVREPDGYGRVLTNRYIPDCNFLIECFCSDGAGGSRSCQVSVMRYSHHTTQEFEL